MHCCQVTSPHLSCLNIILWLLIAQIFAPSAPKCQNLPLVSEANKSWVSKFSYKNQLLYDNLTNESLNYEKVMIHEEIRQHSLMWTIINSYYRIMWNYTHKSVLVDIKLVLEQKQSRLLRILNQNFQHWHKSWFFKTLHKLNF